MALRKAIYFAALLGAGGSLFAWLLAALFSTAVSTSSHPYLADLFLLTALGLVLGPLLIGYFDRKQFGRLRPRIVWMGAGLGLLAALAATGLDAFLSATTLSTSSILYRLAVWVLGTPLLGLAIGMRWVRTNRTRMLHTYGGALIGGFLGGLLFTFLGPHVPEAAQASAVMLLGAGTSFGAAISPVFVREGALEFISSGDARAHAKYSRGKKTWELQHGETYVLGNLPVTQTSTRFESGASIFIPDASLAPRHAVLFGKEGRFFIARHPDASGAAGLARHILRVRGRTVTTSLELKEQDDLLLGKTALRFIARGRA